MALSNVLFNDKSSAICPQEIASQIAGFSESYKNAIAEIIRDSAVLDSEGWIFTNCATRILKNFKMTRRGAFHEELDITLRDRWSTIGPTLFDLKNFIRRSSVSRDRFLLETSPTNRTEIIKTVWQMTKALLPFTMTENSYGLVGASKILFAVLPEIVLPVDNTQWKLLFKTVDLGDVIRFMVADIQRWESTTGRYLNQVDKTRRLTTLPSVYNVMAMSARPISSSTQG